MKKESLRKARKLIADALTKSDIDLIDKIELALNLFELLKEENYEKHIKILRNNNKKGS